MSVLSQKNIFLLYIRWQFVGVPTKILMAWKNFLQFGLNYFSIPQLLKTFFSPWRRYQWFYPRGFDAWRYLETFFSNLISKTLGAVFRTVLILVGILFEAFILAVGFLVFLGWFILPIFLILGIYHGFRLFL